MDLIHVDELVPAPAASWRPGDAWLAGGSWLFSEEQPGISRLLDLGAYRWPALEPDDTGLRIGATCTFAQLAGWTPPAHWPAGSLIAQCCNALLGSFKVWNTATVGGNLCLSLPAGPMTSLTAGLDGRCLIWAADGTPRELPVIDFVTGPGTNVLGPGELLRAVQLPERALRSSAAFRQISLSRYGRSAAVVIGRLDPDDGSVRITISAGLRRPLQLSFAELPSAQRALDTLDRIGPVYYDDVHGAPAWREAMTRLLIAELLDELAVR
ncbi:MAG: FAD binding domain-containing protein [Jatrophihabitans sp.]